MIAQLRDVLQRFGASDAWVVRTPGRCRLDVRVGGRPITLLDDDEEAFWARFYAPVERERVHLGERYLTVEQWRRRPADLAAILRPYWDDAVGSSPAGSAPRSGSAGPRSQRPPAPRSAE